VRSQTAKDQPAVSRAPKAVAFASAMPMIAVAVLAIALANSAFAAETPKAAPTAKTAAEKAAPAKPQSISVDDYFAGVLKPGISASEQAAFAKKHAGANVTWTGYLRTVSKNLSPDGTLYTVILKQKVADEAGKPNGLFVARFTSAAEKELTAMQKDQKVTVTGTLTVGQNPGLPTVDDAKLSGS